MTIFHSPLPLSIRLDLSCSSVHFRGYGEAKLVEKFSSTWAHIPCTRVEINHNALVPGGMPADNNGAESTNRYNNHVAFQVMRSPLSACAEPGGTRILRSKCGALVRLMYMSLQSGFIISQ